MGTLISTSDIDHQMHWAKYSNELDTPIEDRWGLYAADYGVEFIACWPYNEKFNVKN